MGRFVIERRGSAGERLVAQETLGPDDFDAIAKDAGRRPVRARKVGLVAARVAIAQEEVATEWNGEVTRNVAAPDDVIVTNYRADRTPLLDAQGRRNHYVMRKATFEQKYERVAGAMADGQPLYANKGEIVVEAIEFPGGLDVLAGWGKRQTMKNGYLLRSGTAVYGNDRLSFEGTYAVEG